MSEAQAASARGGVEPSLGEHISVSGGRALTKSQAAGTGVGGFGLNSCAASPHGLALQCPLGRNGSNSYTHLFR